MNKTIFITGNSRSGTTMLMRIFDRHPLVKTINESHFLEKYWQPSDAARKLGRTEAAELLTRLVSTQRDGFFAAKNPVYAEECRMLAGTLGDGLDRITLYKTFMAYEAAREGRKVVCEKTPQYVFYIPELLAHFQGACIINMVRDPRAVLVSQKNKWRRRALGSTFMPLAETWRLRINYHPLAMSQLWNASVGAAHRFAGHPQVVSIRYEDLLGDPERIVRHLCEFCGITFTHEMLDIARASSSIRPDDPGQRGIKPSPPDEWKEHLSHNEVSIVQRQCAAYMDLWHYKAIEVPPSKWGYVASLLSYPLQMTLALLVNFSRLRGVRSALQRRFRNLSFSNLKPV